jgi:sedoheptulose-bisphosphatase
VAFDPLDGSSIVDTNFAVGTIFGVWPGDKLTGITGRDQAAAGMAIYGPRTLFVIALRDAPGCHEFVLQDDGKWLHFKETTTIGESIGGRQEGHGAEQAAAVVLAGPAVPFSQLCRPRAPPQLAPPPAPHPLPCAGEGKLFSPGNLRATFDNPNYERLIAHYIGEKYTLRYTGGMVPDVFQIIVKEKGVFTNVTSPSTKAKLRILFEVAPLALLVEKAGGASSCDGKLVSGLDVDITAYDQRTQICYGSVGEVKRFEEYLYGSSPRFADVKV